MINATFSAMLALVLLMFAMPVCGQSGPTAVNLPDLHVGSFKPVELGHSGFGPLHALNTDLHRMKADSNATKLSAALVKALTNKMLKADQFDASSPSARSGWLIEGVFYALDENARLVSVPFLGAHDGPNVEVSVTIADCARDPATPFAIIGTDAILKGQATAISWNPYVAAAKFVVHQVQGQDSTAVLADQIAVKIIEQRGSLLAHDPSNADRGSGN
jgi:Domain of unknown function (DUF4410)